MVSLDLTALERAFNRFQEGLAERERRPQDDLVRDGLIQRFEYTYELTAKTLRRFLELTSSGGETIDAFSFPAIIRTASEQGLLESGWDVWEEFRKARNLTSHTYNETAALEVIRSLPRFHDEIAFLLQRLKERCT
jgi:nucleotidyltransferase substrate binding protein (TIGR01987 family)